MVLSELVKIFFMKLGVVKEGVAAVDWSDMDT
jgi:hypothetical protein